MRIYCYDQKKSRNVLVGEYNDFDYTFIKRVKSNHFMVKEKSYGIQEEVLQQLKKLGCINVLLITKTGQQISLLDDWLKKPIKNYGHGNQRFIGGK